MGKSSLKKKSRTERKRGKSSSKRNKSRKIRRRGRSLSDSYDSASSTSSEEYHSSRRSRSLTRKGGKKKAKRRSLSGHSSGEEAHHSRKRRGSKRREEKRARKSIRDGKKKKKKRKRDVSVSESKSCSTCQGGSSGDETEFHRKRACKARNGQEKGTGRPRSFSPSSRTSDHGGGYQSEETKVKNTRQDSSATAIAEQDEKASPLNIRSDIRKRRRSRSCSPLTRSIDSSGYQSEEKVIKMNNVRKLRSVITIVRWEENVGTSEDGDLKEEILYDRDCYQNTRTNGTGNTKDFTHHSDVISETKRHANDGQGQTAITPGIDTTSTVKEICMAEGGSEKGNFGKGRETEVSSSPGSLKGDDLESILRQRALENLRKFRGGKQTNANLSVTQEDKKDSALKKPYSSKDESFQISFKEDDAGAVSTGQASEQIRQPIAGKGAPGPMPSDSQKTPDKNGISQELGAPLLEGSSLDRKDPKEKLNAAVDFGPKELPTSSFQQRSRGMRIKPEHIPAAREGSPADLATGSAGIERPSGTAGSDLSDKVNNVSGSADMHTAPESTSGDIRSDNLLNQTKESSEFEQKTMSVMRGGEMVQVSYKVYIPKKAPALARRQLKR